MEFRFPLKVVAANGYGRIGLAIPPRPSVVPDFNAGFASGSVGSKRRVTLLPGPRGVSRSSCFPDVGPGHILLRDYRLLRSSPPCQSPGSAPGWPRFGFLPLRRFRPGWLAFGGHASRSGVRRVSTLSTPTLHLVTSRVCFTPVRPWGFPLQGFYFPRIARASRPSPAFVAFDDGVRNSVIAAFKALIPSGGRHPAAAFSAETGRYPPGVFAFSRSVLPVSPSFRTGTSSDFALRLRFHGDEAWSPEATSRKAG